MAITIVPREEWGAVPPTEELDPLEPQIERVIFTLDEDNVPPCKTSEDCVKSIRMLQTYYMKERKMPDIPYNFVIGNDGKVYEGRGWYKKPQKSKTHEDHHDKVIDIGILSGHVNEPLNKRRVLEYDSVEMGTRFVKEEGVAKYIISEYFDFVGYTGQYEL